MRSLLPLLVALTLACEVPPENKLAVDNDGDGFSEFEGDCDDADPSLGLQSEDEDCDGVLTIILSGNRVAPWLYQVDGLRTHLA